MRVGAYIDGFNLYYGGRGICGRGVPGWRWLDLRALVDRVVRNASKWPIASELRVVYCTARIKGPDNPEGQRDQNVYLRALKAAHAVDAIEMGTYVNRVATSPLATSGRRGRPVIASPAWPMMVQDGNSNPLSEAKFIASIARREEKGSDVNVAVHLLRDVLTSAIDAAVVISNDSDLSLPVHMARDEVPVGLVNPTGRYPAGALNDPPGRGPGQHWWYQLTSDDFRSCQLPQRVGKYRMPVGW